VPRRILPGRAGPCNLPQANRRRLCAFGCPCAQPRVPHAGRPSGAMRMVAERPVPCRQSPLRGAIPPFPSREASRGQMAVVSARRYEPPAAAARRGSWPASCRPRRSPACQFSSSAICTAFSAAPFRNWSPLTNRSMPRPSGWLMSCRIRPVYTSSCSDDSSGIGK